MDITRTSNAGMGHALGGLRRPRRGFFYRNAIFAELYFIRGVVFNRHIEAITDFAVAVTALGRWIEAFRLFKNYEFHRTVLVGLAGASSPTCLN
jgi:hypothetical protein